MIPAALEFKDRYSELKMPVSIVAGENDRLIDMDKQSRRLHAEVAHSRFHSIPDNGHMVHQTATKSVMSAINEVSGNMPSQPVRNANVGEAALPT